MLLSGAGAASRNRSRLDRLPNTGYRYLCYLQNASSGDIFSLMSSWQQILDTLWVFDLCYLQNASSGDIFSLMSSWQQVFDTLRPLLPAECLLWRNLQPHVQLATFLQPLPGLHNKNTFFYLLTISGTGMVSWKLFVACSIAWSDLLLTLN